MCLEKQECKGMKQKAVTVRLLDVLWIHNRADVARTSH